MEKEIIEEEIDLREYLEVIWKNRSLILAILFVSLILSGSYSYFVMQDEYQTDAVIYLKNLPVDFSNSEIYSDPAFIIQTMTSSEVILKTVEQSGLANAFANSDRSGENAASWLSENIRITQNKNNMKDLLNLQLRGSLEPEILQNTLRTHIEVVKAENKKRLSRDIEDEKERIGIMTSYLIEQRTNTVLAMDKTVEEDQSDRTVMFMNIMDQSSRLNAIDDRLNALQMTRINLEFIEAADYEMIEMISSPGIPEKVGPSRGMNIMIAGILGLFIGIIAAFFKNYLEG